MSNHDEAVRGLFDALNVVFREVLIRQSTRLFDENGVPPGAFGERLRWALANGSDDLVCKLSDISERCSQRDALSVSEGAPKRSGDV